MSDSRKVLVRWHRCRGNVYLSAVDVVAAVLALADECEDPDAARVAFAVAGALSVTLEV